MEHYDRMWTNVDEEGRKKLRYHKGPHRGRWHEYKKVGEAEMESIKQELTLRGLDWRVTAADHLQSKFLLAQDEHGKPLSFAKYFATIVAKHTVHKTE